MSKVLILEDSVDLSEMYVQLFTLYRHNVTVLSSGKNIDDVINNIQPDVILLDIYLGGEDGREICKHIKQTHNSIPIVMVSVCLGLQEKARECGADDYVVKPFDIDVLMGKVTEWVTKYQQLIPESIK
jgi:DNA-binding response OmpR family regulator